MCWAASVRCHTRAPPRSSGLLCHEPQFSSLPASLLRWDAQCTSTAQVSTHPLPACLASSYRAPADHGMSFIRRGACCSTVVQFRPMTSIRKPSTDPQHCADVVREVRQMASMRPSRPTAPILGSASFSRCLTSVIRMNKPPACLTLDWPRAGPVSLARKVSWATLIPTIVLSHALYRLTRIHKVSTGRSRLVAHS